MGCLPGSLAFFVGFSGRAAGCYRKTNNTMSVLRSPAAVLAATLVCALACSGGAPPEVRRPAGPAAELRVRRGDFQERFALTGELAAARATMIVVPRVPTWQVTVRWLETDGADVKKGQRVAELDNSSFATSLKEKENAEIQAEHDLEKTRAERAAEISEKEFEVERKLLGRQKAQIEAALPEGLRSRREAQDKALALQRSVVEEEKAQADLLAARTAAEAEIENSRLALESARRAIGVARDAVRELTLTAPRDGVLIVGDHPWEGRKIQVGDSVWVGFTLATLPDLGSLEVAASLFDVDDGKVRVGQRAEVVLDSDPDTSWPASIAEVSPVAQESGPTSLRRMFRVKARLERVDPIRMRPGLSARLTVFGESRRQALLVPRGGIDFSRAAPAAILRDGTRAPVQLGPCDAEWCVEEKGPSEGTGLAGPLRPVASAP